MYKVFIDNAAILFRKSFFYQSAIPKKFLPTLPPILFSQFKEELTQISKEKELVVLTPNPKHALQSFFKNFRWIEAAGGIVVHKENKKSLFIFRNNKWDIPKGKIEKGETPALGAIREIQEECGIKNL